MPVYMHTEAEELEERVHVNHMNAFAIVPTDQLSNIAKSRPLNLLGDNCLLVSFFLTCSQFFSYSLSSNMFHTGTLSLRKLEDAARD